MDRCEGLKVPSMQWPMARLCYTVGCPIRPSSLEDAVLYGPICKPCFLPSNPPNQQAGNPACQARLQSATSHNKVTCACHCLLPSNSPSPWSPHLSGATSACAGLTQRVLCAKLRCMCGSMSGMSVSATPSTARAASRQRDTAPVPAPSSNTTGWRLPLGQVRFPRIEGSEVRNWPRTMALGETGKGHWKRRGRVPMSPKHAGV